jgi:hypothetical protein
MVKSSTVIKRAFSDAWKPALEGAAFMAGIIGLGFIGQWLFDIEWFKVSVNAFFLALFLWGIKAWYDYKKWQIEFEQEKMLKNLGKKDD